VIPNQWYVVLDSSEVKKKPVGVTRMGEKLVFWRDKNGHVACFRDQCVHRGVQISRGKILEEGHLQCPFHGLEYDPTGRVCIIPASGRDTPVPEQFKANVYPVHEKHEFIWIWWGDEPPEDLEPPSFFEGLDDRSLSHAKVTDLWNTHYSRVIEVNLDTHHVPFLHRSTIGRHGKTVIDGPGVMWISDEAFMVQPMFRKDDGTPAKKSTEVKMPLPKDYKMRFIFPNLWENYVNEKLRVIVAFAPVDDEHTLLYMRTYQGFVNVPLIGKLFSKMFLPLNLYITRQDKVVVQTHHDKASQLNGVEKLIPADYPILEYRKKRQALIDLASSKK
jgi:phenylpropionate dioxygenase-like ring-hydroxylating dioxygenase large terminal subunit